MKMQWQQQPCAVAMNVPIEIIHKAMINFVAVEHRIEYVCTKHA